MAQNISDIWYAACFTEDDGIYSCVHEHPSVRDAMNCLVPDGGCFLRACDRGVWRSLNDAEFGEFLVALYGMSWARLNKP